MARVLFVNNSSEPLGIMYISSALKKAGHHVQITLGRDPIAVAREFKPHILAYSIHTGHHLAAIRLNKRIRQEIDALSVFGGPHATFFPEIIKQDKVDAVCVGEGEEAMVDLANSIDSGQIDLHIPNWHFKINGKIIRNGVRPFADVEILSPPDRELIYDVSIRQRHHFAKSFTTTRGCPYGCTYCFNEGLFEIYGERKIRQQSVDKTIAEVVAVREKYPLPSLIFYDDTFGMNKAWLREFAAKYPREVGIPFQCNIRPELTTDETVKLLKQAGCVGVTFGIEAGDERIRREILRRNMSDEQITAASKLLKQYGLSVTGLAMVGLPTTTLKDDIRTIELATKCQPDALSVFIYQPYPGTILGDFCFENDLVEGTVDDIPSDFKSQTMLKMSVRRKRQVANIRHFAGFVSEFPWLLPFARILIELPLSQYYRTLAERWLRRSLARRVHKIPANWMAKLKV